MSDEEKDREKLDAVHNELKATDKTFPCRYCGRCKNGDTARCGNKKCPQFMAWFSERWNALRKGAGIW